MNKDNTSVRNNVRLYKENKKNKNVTLNAYSIKICCAPIEIEIAEGDGMATDLMVRPEAARSCVAARHRLPSPFSIRESIGFQSLT